MFKLRGITVKRYECFVPARKDIGKGAVLWSEEIKKITTSWRGKEYAEPNFHIEKYGRPRRRQCRWLQCATRIDTAKVPENATAGSPPLKRAKKRAPFSARVVIVDGWLYRSLRGGQSSVTDARRQCWE